MTILRVHMSWWGMSGVRQNGKESDMEAKFRLIAESGFDGIDAQIPEAGETAKQWRRLLDDYGLSLSVNIYPSSLEEFKLALDRIADYGGAVTAINTQVLTPFLTGTDAETLLSGIVETSRSMGLPVNVETHRGTITQDLIRTAEYVRRIPQLRLTADFSHYVLAGEMLSIPPQAETIFAELLTRTDCIHARVSNGEQIQVDLGAEGAHPMLEHFKRWWSHGMKEWRNAHPNGGSFLFIPELGPPPYAIATDEISGRTNEFSDRWEQSLYLLQLARELWDANQ